MSPAGVPVYDGVGLPDEPYRYVVPVPGEPATEPPAVATATTPVTNGTSAAGLAVTSAEMGPQVNVFVPLGALAAPAGTITVSARPQAPADPPDGYRVDGNRYRITVTGPAGPVMFTGQAAFATVQLRATTQQQPGPVFLMRPGPGAAWRELATSRGGLDVYGAALPSPGEYQLAFHTGTGGGGGVAVLPFVLGGGVLLLVVAVILVRRRSPSGR